MHDRILQGQIKPIGLDTPSVVVVVLPAVNDVIVIIRIDAVAEARTRARAITACRALAGMVGVDPAQGIAAVAAPLCIAVGTEEGQALVARIGNFHVLNEIIRAKDANAVTKDLIGAVTGEVADGRIGDARIQLEARVIGATGWTDNHCFSGCSLHGDIARRGEVIFGIGAAVNRQGIATTQDGDPVLDCATGGRLRTGIAVTPRGRHMEGGRLCADKQA